MFDDLGAMFYENVVPAYNALVEQREGDTAGLSRHLRVAIGAASALFHFREHLPAQHALTRGQVVAACSEYRLIADVANASKHQALNRDTSEGPPLVKSAKDIRERIVITQYEDAEGPYIDERTIVFVACSDGIERSVDAALTNVFNYWGAMLQQMGVIDFVASPQPEVPGRRLIPRAEAKRLNLEARNTVRFKQNFQLQRFNAITGQAEPVDLTGTKIFFRLHIV